MDTLTFLNELYQDASGWLSIWTPDKKTYWFHVPDQLTDAATFNAQTDIYFGVGLTNQRQQYGRISADRVTGIPGLWMDIDIKGPGHKQQNLPETLEDTLSICPVNPTLIIQSGGGYHLYWLFKEFWHFDAPEEHKQAAELLAGFQATIRNLASQRGWKLDSTHDLSRVLRIPNTTNYKYNVPVTVIQHEDDRYNQDDLEQYATVDTDSAPVDNRTEKFKRYPTDGESALVIDKCKFVQHCRDDAATLTEPDWTAMVGNIARCKDGPEAVHALSQPYPGYSELETDKKIIHTLNGMKPQTCKYIRETLLFNGCPGKGCGVRAPCGLALQKKKKKQDAAPSADISESEWAPMEKLTDLGNAERFTRLHGDKLKYCFHFANWLVWDGKRHKLDETGQVMKYAKQTIRGLYDEAKKIPDEDIGKAIIKHAKKSESAGALKAMLTLAQHMLPVHIDELDSDMWLMNVTNGVLDLRTGELLPHDQSRIITKLSPVEYNPKATAPRFEQFLREVFPASEELIKFVRNWLGYCLTGNTDEQKLAICHGPEGGNGKGTLLNLIRDIMGDYAEVTPTSTFLAKASEGIPNDIARLRGARFVLASEAGKGKNLNEPLIKSVTGQDKLTARFLRCEFFTFEPEFKLNLLVNERPVASGDDGALWRRIQLIPFEVKFRGAKRDGKLPAKLREEMPGILNWLIEGCLDWQKNGLQPSQEVIKATSEYQSENDSMQAWMSENCVVFDTANVKISDLYENYYEFMSKNHEKSIVSKVIFIRKMKEKNFIKYAGTGNVQRLRGIGLRENKQETLIECGDTPY